MGFRQRFEFGLAWRIIALGGALWLLVLSVATPDLRAGRIVALTAKNALRSRRTTSLLCVLFSALDLPRWEQCDRGEYDAAA